MTLDDIRRRAQGFLSETDIADVVRLKRLELLLIRCGGGRFLAPAQDVLHFCAIIDRDGEDYIRDVSFPANHIGFPAAPAPRTPPGFDFRTGDPLTPPPFNDRGEFDNS